MKTSREPHRFEFGDFVLDRRRRRLTGARGAEVPLSGKAFDALAYFVEHPGQVLDRPTLLDALWPDTVVEENNLSQVVAVLRRTLGEGLIVTVPRRGYQFVAEVRAVDQPDPPSPRRGAWPLRATLAVGAALVVASLYYVAVGIGSREPPRLSVDDPRPMVAVLPCTNLSPDPDDAYFASGIHEEILNQLTKLDGVRVIARSSVLRFGEDPPSIPVIARSLGAAAIVECSVRRAGASIMVSARLVDPATGLQVWSESYPGDLDDLDVVFAMQADIAASIARVLDAELSPEDATRFDAHATDSVEAYSALLKATEAEPLEGLRLLDTAIELDPEFGLAYATRGLLRLVLAVEALSARGSVPGTASLIAQAVADAERALAIDPNIGLAHIVAGARFMGPPVDVARWDAAVQRALALSPTDPRVLFLAGGWYLAQQRLDEAGELLALLARIDPDAELRRPGSPLGPFLLFAGQLAQARALQVRALDAEPTAAWRWQVAAFYDALLGEADEALRKQRIVEQLAADLPDDEMWNFGFMAAYTYGRLGRPDDARRVFGRFVAPFLDGPLRPSPWTLMVAYLGVGDTDRAYQAAARVRRPDIPWPDASFWLVLNPLGDPVLERAEFMELRRTLGYLAPAPGRP